MSLTFFSSIFLELMWFLQFLPISYQNFYTSSLMFLYISSYLLENMLLSFDASFLRLRITSELSDIYLLILRIQESIFQRVVLRPVPGFFSASLIQIITRYNTRSGCLQYKQAPTNYKMDLETRSNKQSQLRLVFSHTQELIKKRVDSLVAQLETLANSSSQLDLLQNIHLDQALTEIANKAHEKRERQLNEIPEEQDIDLEIKNQVQQQNQILLNQMTALNSQIQELNAKRQKHQVARKLIQRKILELQEQKLKLVDAQSSNRVKYLKHLSSPAFQFCFQTKENSEVVFRKDFVSLTNHLLGRVEQNWKIIQKLQNAVQRKIEESQLASAKHQELQQRQKKYNYLVDRIEDQKQKYKECDQQLKRCIQQASQKIQLRLPSAMDNNIARLWNRNQQLKNAYHSILDLLKNVKDAIEVDKLTDYIEQL